jgi:tetratricopeptide (TPR) repeat protein
LELVRSPNGTGLLLLHFERPVTVAVRQRGDLSRLVVDVDLPAVDETMSTSTLPPVVLIPQPTGSRTVGINPDRLARAEARAELATEATFKAPSVELKMYAVNLESALQPVDAGQMGAEMSAQGLQFYSTEVVIDGRTWYRLRLGFFRTESEAEAVLESVHSEYPEGWVVRVPDTEHSIAAANVIEITGKYPVNTDQTSTGLSVAQIDELMHEAQSSMLSGDNDRAIQIYTKVLREPEHAASREAQEYLGLARERNGQSAHAVTEYRRYLMLYPDGEEAARVSQRLAGLTAVRVARDTAIEPRRHSSRSSRWDVYGGLAQYYRRDESQFDGGERVVGQSSVLTDFDLITRRRGERMDFSSRLTLGNLYDLLGEEQGPGNSTRIYYLYADLVDSRWDWSARVGRQSLHSSGVLGRFDGAHLSWQWRPDTRLNVMSGFPVDSSIDSIDTDRMFYGISADLTNVFEIVDISLFYNTQSADGIDERQAVGAELRYFDTARSLVSLIDYDISYSEINSFVMLGNWAFPNRVTLNAMADFRKSPMLTTRNALIGQGDTTLDELVVLFGEDEVRQLARDRTGELQTYSLGVSLPLFDRFQLNTDLSMVDYTGTFESGGVLAVPDSGGSLYYSMTLIGSGLLVAGDRSLFGVGYADGNGTSTTSLSFDKWTGQTPSGGSRPHRCELCIVSQGISNLNWRLAESGPARKLTIQHLTTMPILFTRVTGRISDVFIGTRRHVDARKNQDGLSCLSGHRCRLCPGGTQRKCYPVFRLVPWRHGYDPGGALFVLSKRAHVGCKRPRLHLRRTDRDKLCRAARISSLAALLQYD